MESINLLENIGSENPIATTVADAFSNFGVVNPFATYGNGSGTGAPTLNQDLETILETVSIGAANSLLTRSPQINRDKTINSPDTPRSLIDEITGETLFP